MLNSKSKEGITSFTANTSFSTQHNITSSSNRPKSFFSRRRSSRKSLTPLDPKLYRIAYSGYNQLNKPPIKKKRKKKQLVPFYSTSTQAHSHHEQTIGSLAKGNTIQMKRVSPKFISMKTFNIVKKSWSKKDLSIGSDNGNDNEQGLGQIRERKKTKKKTKSSSINRKLIRPKPHFSDVFGMSKRNAKSLSNQKNKKPIENNNKGRVNVTSSPINHIQASGYSRGSSSNASEKNSSGVSLPKIDNKDKKNIINRPNKPSNNQAVINERIIKQRPMQNLKQQQKDNDNNENESVRNINNSFTFGKEPSNTSKQQQYSTISNNSLSMHKGKLPSLNPKGINRNTIARNNPNIKVTHQQNTNTHSNANAKGLNQIKTTKTMPNVIQVTTTSLNSSKINNNQPTISDKNIKPSVLNLSPNFITAKSIRNINQTSPSEKFNQTELREISNVNKVNINSVISNNLILNAEIQQSMNHLIDNSQCVYCLKRVNHPLTLTCNHEVCRKCAEEIISLSSFTKVSQATSQLTIKCPKCELKTKVAASLDELERSNWRPIELSESEKALEKIQVCEICPSSKYIRDIAEFECLNCDILLCYECRIRHLGNIRHQSHKIIQYHKIVQEKVELTLCDYHREPLKLYCLTDSKAICVICANYETNHKEHSIKTVKNVIDEQSIQLASVIREKESHIRLIEELIAQLTYAIGKLEEEKTNFFDKMNQVYEKLYDIIRQHEEKLKKEVNDIFEGKLYCLNTKLKNFKYVKTRYEDYRNLICEKDIDIIDRVALITKLNHKIDKMDQLAFLRIKTFNKSLADSQLIHTPIEDISKSMTLFKFLPITEVNITILTTLFASSNIIKKDMIFTDLVLLLPKIKSGVLLYQISKDGANTKTFHEKCDNKGPTITLVKTEEGHVFGGFNPMSWISESMYNETEESYLFKLGYGMNEKGLKCPVKKYMKHHAIKQNGEGYSPGFGEIDSADLFISYKNLKNSYSNLGKVYKTPKGFDPSSFLAGRSNNWNIVEVEIYAIEVMSEEEYYKTVLA